MNPQTRRAHRRPRVAMLLGAISAATVLAFAAGCGDDDESAAAAYPTTTTEAAAEDHATESAVIHTEAGHELQDAMRAAWQEHGNLTVRAIVAAVNELPETEPVVAALLQNQERIGDAIKPYYGDAAGEQLTKLLEEHINTAVGVVGAAASGDAKATKKASAKFYANGEEIAKFLAEANPENWTPAEMKEMMNHHLDQVVELATLEIEGDYEQALEVYDEYIDHILVGMADMLSSGIMAQYPEQFE